jgi:ComF family protein
LISLARDVLKPVLELVYPTYCGGCGRQGDVLCRACLDSFRPVDRIGACPVCGRWTGAAVACGACLTHPASFGRGHFGYVFEGPVREALHAFKFRGRKDVGRALVQTLEERITSMASDFDLIVPLPVTEKRLRARGFNQCFIVSEEISRITGKPIDHRTLRKTRETQDQYTLPKEERKKNLVRAFSIEGPGEALRGKRVLLVDDLYTTGSTAREVSKTIARAKTRAILFFALARTP